MATLNPDFVLQMSAYGSDFDFNGNHYKTLWTLVRGPVASRRNWKQDWILVDMWQVDESGDQILDGDCDVGSDPWIAALQETAFDRQRIRIGELGAFRFDSGYAPDKPRDYVEADLYFELCVMDVDKELEKEGEAPMQARPKFHSKLIEILKAYEYYREKELRNSLYFYHWSRDCDLCESEGIQVFDGWYEAAEWIKGFYDWAEGPQTLEQVTYETWREFNAAPVRDRALEQFEEYGYGH